MTENTPFDDTIQYAIDAAATLVVAGIDLLEFGQMGRALDCAKHAQGTLEIAMILAMRDGAWEDYKDEIHAEQENVFALRGRLAVVEHVRAGLTS